MILGSVHFTYQGDIDAYELKFNLNFMRKGTPQHTEWQSFLSLLKLIPASDRSYNPITHIWLIDAKHYGIVKPLLANSFDPVFEFTKEQYDEQQKEWAHQAAPPIPVDTHKATVVTILRSVGVLPANEILPTEFGIANKLYRRACMLLHPDRNTDPKAAVDISRLNEAWAVLKVEEYKIGAIANAITN